MKKLILSIAILVTIFAMPKSVLAQENCVTVYGGGVVCGAETHEPVETDLGDINLTVLGIGFLVASGSLLYFSKKFAGNKQIKN